MIEVDVVFGPKRDTRAHPWPSLSILLFAEWHEQGIVTGAGNPMAEQQIRFDDGAAYEQMMGIWSRSAGEIFLDWLAPPLGLRWIDIGCGNGAFTELLVERCGPIEVQGIDPSEEQLAFARTRPAARMAKFHQGDAMDLPFADGSFDAAVMALVLVFVPDPAKGVSEMVRVVLPGGAVVTYMWDMLGGGFPLDPIYSEIQAMDIAAIRPPRMDASRMEALRDLWIGAGLEDVQTREIAVHRTFANFDDFWITNLKSPALRPTVAAMKSRDVDTLISRVRARLPADADGRITCNARAHAVRGRRPK
jgi:SAM-dependent methyltransferase